MQLVQILVWILECIPEWIIVYILECIPEWILEWILERILEGLSLLTKSGGQTCSLPYIFHYTVEGSYAS